jgi:uncharacterized protein YdeI (YjbR/CyaY-like superfamily)
MKMAYRKQWETEIEELRRVLARFPLKEESKWGKPCFTLEGRNLVLIQGFKEYCSLLFFQGALLKDERKLLVQLGQTQAARVMKFTSAKEVAAKAAAIKAYVREAIAAERAGRKVELKKTSDFALPEELLRKFKQDPNLKKAFEALTLGRQRGYVYHFAGAKQSATRTARIEKARPGIFAGRGYLERTK